MYLSLSWHDGVVSGFRESVDDAGDRWSRPQPAAHAVDASNALGRKAWKRNFIPERILACPGTETTNHPPPKTGSCPCSCQGPVRQSGCQDHSRSLCPHCANWPWPAYWKESHCVCALDGHPSSLKLFGDWTVIHSVCSLPCPHPPHPLGFSSFLSRHREAVMYNAVVHSSVFNDACGILHIVQYVFFWRDHFWFPLCRHIFKTKNTSLLFFRSSLGTILGSQRNFQSCTVLHSLMELK